MLGDATAANWGGGKSNGMKDIWGGEDYETTRKIREAHKNSLTGRSEYDFLWEAGRGYKVTRCQRTIRRKGRVENFFGKKLMGETAGRPTTDDSPRRGKNQCQDGSKEGSTICAKRKHTYRDKNRRSGGHWGILSVFIQRRGGG